LLIRFVPSEQFQLFDHPLTNKVKLLKARMPVVPEIGLPVVAALPMLVDK